MDWCLQRLHRECGSQAAFRPGFILIVLAMLVSLLMYPLVKSLGLHLHSAITGNYISEYHSVALITCPNEQTAKDIARAIMEKRLAGCVSILPKSSTMYYWKGEIQDATEILLLAQTRTSKIQKLMEYIRSIHPFRLTPFMSFPIDHGNPFYMQWLDESVPDD